MVGLRRFGAFLPSVPEGDLAVLGGGAARVGRSIGDVIAPVERRLRDCPNAGVSLLVLVIVLGAALLGGRGTMP